MPKNIIITESQLQLLKEYHGDQLLPFDGNGNKMNVEHYIDFLEHIGRFGRLESQIGKNPSLLQKLLDKGHEEGLNEWTCDDYIEQSDERDSASKERNASPEERNSSSEDINSSTAETSNSELIGNDDEIKLQLYNKHLSDFGFPDGLDIDENGLIYCERTITIPSPMETDSDSAYYEFITNYDSVGKFWTWFEGHGQAYCGQEGEPITLIGRTRPEDIDWGETFYRNAYGLNEERELYLAMHSLVQINAIRLEDRTVNLPRPIVVPAHLEISPQDIRKTIAVSESQIQQLNEYHGDQLLPFDGNGNKMNIEHYIDFLEHIGRFGRLESRLGKDKAQFQIFLNQVQEDGFGYWYHNFDTSSFEDDGLELSEDDIRQLYYDKLSEYHFPESLDVDENGLIYCERTIKIPSPMETAYDRAYYNYITQYSSVGEYWTWLEGHGEAYCGSGGMDITLIGRTRPEDVNWDETFMRNAYELNEECELYLGYSSLVQINAIRLNDRVINLPRPIVVPAHSHVSPQEIYKKAHRL